VIAHDDVFPPDTDDRSGCAAGQRRWIVLMKDDRVRYRPGEARMVVEAAVAPVTVAMGTEEYALAPGVTRRRERRRLNHEA
jgi:hypothetical protein